MACWSLLESSGCTSSGSPTALPPPPGSPSVTFHSPRLYLEVASAAAPHRPSAVALFCSTPSQEVAHEGGQLENGTSVFSPDHQSCAESLPDRQHHQPSNRHGTKMGHKPRVRPGYSNTPFPQHYRVPMRAKPGPPSQLFLGAPLSTSHPTQMQGGRPQNAPLPREEGCCWSAAHSSCQT